MGQTYPALPFEEYGAPPVSPIAHPPAPPSEWILYRRPYSCCGPIGGHGPIQTELYFRTGVSFPFGDSIYGNLLQPGWVVQGGGRVLLFDAAMTGAWFLDVGISNTWNEERHRNTQVPLSVLEPNAFGQVERVNFGEGNIPGVTVRDLNRTFVNFGGGKFWYIDDLGGYDAWRWRFGFDGGGRWGSGRARFVELRQRTDTMYGMFVGMQADVEIPCGCCQFIGGIRTEWSHTWTDVLQHNPANFHEINLLFHFGVRF